jgi:hypothetical protein
MNTIKMFESWDGEVFGTAEACLEHERLLEQVRDAMDGLCPGDPKGATYVQHDRETLLRVKRRLWAIVVGKFGDSYPAWKTWKADDVHPCSVVGRVLYGCGGPLANGWSSLARVDFDPGREYEQPYFAAHPNEAPGEYKP